jgi:hypothetical protein
LQKPKKSSVCGTDIHSALYAGGVDDHDRETLGTESIGEWRQPPGFDGSQPMSHDDRRMRALPIRFIEPCLEVIRGRCYAHGGALNSSHKNQLPLKIYERSVSNSIGSVVGPLRGPRTSTALVRCGERWAFAAP